MAASVDILHTIPNGLEVASAVLVGMPDAVRADALEDAAIFAPVQWRIAKCVTRGVSVYTTPPPLTLPRFMQIDQAGTIGKLCPIPSLTVSG